MKHLIGIRNPSSKKEIKILFLIFIIHIESLADVERRDKFYEYKSIFRSLDIDWWVKPNTAHHRGLSYQSILNTDSIEHAKKICDYIQTAIDEPLLICISKDIVSKKEPVGESTDESWTKIGRLFDRRVQELYTDENGFINKYTEIDIVS